MIETEKLCAFLDAKKDDMVRDVMEFVKIPSVSSDIREVTRSLHFILALATEMGFETRAVLDDQVGIIEFGEGKETLGILAHVDVVPASESEDWDNPPFEPVVNQGAIWGRGTMDDKGPIIASLYALKSVTSLGLPFHKKVQIVLGTQEEVEWTDMGTYVKEFPLPDYGFTPDGEFPLCNIEKGVGWVETAFKRFSAEDKGGCTGKYKIKSIDGGITRNMIPGECTAVLAIYGENGEEKDFKVTASGRAAHACMPENGENAIINLCHMLNALPLVKNQASKAVEFVLEKFGDIYCSGIGLDGKPEYINGEYTHKNTMSPTMISTDETEIVINVDMRIAYGTTTEEVLSAFENRAQMSGGYVKGSRLMPVTYIDRQLPFMQAFACAYDKLSGMKNEFTLAPGGSYAKAMPNIVSWGPIFPGEEDKCHEMNEHILIESLMKCSKIFAEAIAQIALSEKSYL